MRCAPPSSYCTCFGPDALLDDPPPREAQDPGVLTAYRRFWRDSTPWQTFIVPPWSPGEALTSTRTEPGVYELGISVLPAHTTVIPVYIGQSSNIRSRHLAYLRGGDHIKELVVPLVSSGYTIWQRVRYVRTPLQAQRWEAKFLVDYDYAFNAQLNPPKRDVRLEYRDCCWCTVGIDVITMSTERSIANGRRRTSSVGSSPPPTLANGGGTAGCPPHLALTVETEEPLSRVHLLTSPLRSCARDTWIVCLVLQIFVSITIIAIVAAQLQGGPFGTPPPSTSTGTSQSVTIDLTSQCLLGVSDNGKSLCIYAWVVSGSSIIFSLLLVAVSELCLARRPRAGGWMSWVESGFSGLLTMWWAVAAIVLTNYSLQADVQNIPKSNWRTAVWIMSWLQMGLWGLCFITKTMVSLFRCCASKSKPFMGGTGRVIEGGGPMATAVSGPPTGPPLPPPPPSRDPEVPSPTAPAGPGSTPESPFSTMPPV